VGDAVGERAAVGAVAALERADDADELDLEVVGAGADDGVAVAADVGEGEVLPSRNAWHLICSWLGRGRDAAALIWLPSKNSPTRRLLLLAPAYWEWLVEEPIRLVRSSLASSAPE